MNRLSLRIRITLTTGLIVFIVSICTMLISTYYAQVAINEAVTVTNDYYFDYLANDNQNIAMAELYLAEDSDSLDEDYQKSQNTENQIEEYPVFYMDNQNVDFIKENFQMIEFFISLGASFIGMLLAYYFSSKMLRPLNNLSSKMLTVSQKNLNQTIEEYGTNDEIGNLTFAFNKMIGRLNNQFSRQKAFSSNVAHELKTPLTIMKMSYQVMDEEANIEDFKQITKINQKQVDNLVKICDDLLLYANNEMTENKEVINLDDILKSIIGDLSLLIKEKNINIVDEIDDTIAVIGNRRLVYQLFSNLINNAIKYNYKDGSIYIVVHKYNNSIEVIIADNGMGMSPETVDKVFEPFYRENKSRSRKTGGSGLGLAIVKQIVDLHRWSISVESIKNKKTIFTIKI